MSRLDDREADRDLADKIGIGTKLTLVAALDLTKMRTDDGNDLGRAEPLLFRLFRHGELVDEPWERRDRHTSWVIHPLIAGSDPPPVVLQPLTRHAPLRMRGAVRNARHLLPSSYCRAREEECMGPELGSDVSFKPRHVPITIDDRFDGATDCRPYEVCHGMRECFGLSKPASCGDLRLFVTCRNRESTHYLDRATADSFRRQHDRGELLLEGIGTLVINRRVDEHIERIQRILIFCDLCRARHQAEPPEKPHASILAEAG